MKRTEEVPGHPLPTRHLGWIYGESGYVGPRQSKPDAVHKYMGKPRESRSKASTYFDPWRTNSVPVRVRLVCLGCKVVKIPPRKLEMLLHRLKCVHCGARFKITKSEPPKPVSGPRMERRLPGLDRWVVGAGEKQRYPSFQNTQGACGTCGARLPKPKRWDAPVQCGSCGRNYSAAAAQGVRNKARGLKRPQKKAIRGIPKVNVRVGWVGPLPKRRYRRSA